MRIGGIGGPAIATTPGSSQAGSREASGRALIAIEATGATADPWPRHQSAPFLAHLIATRMQAPQTRERRRAEPEQAIESYRSSPPAHRPATARTMLSA